MLHHASESNTIDQNYVPILTDSGSDFPWRSFLSQLELEVELELELGKQFPDTLLVL